MTRILPLSRSIVCRVASGAVMLLLGLTAAQAETELSFYSGMQAAAPSRVTGALPGGVGFDEVIGWEGRPFRMPPYYGLRAIWWQSETLGFGAEFTHAKVYAPDEDANAVGFDNLELTDGLNILTANVMRRWPGAWMDGAITPYIGGGLGLSIPHVDFETQGGSKTFGYQVTGPALRFTAGISYDLSDRFAVFGEYQFTHSRNRIDLNDGGTLDTDVSTNALNLGLSLNF